MSGRPKPGRGDEAEQLRGLIRQAHEAAQEVKAAMRDYGALVQAARGEVISELQAYMAQQVDIGVAALTAVIESKDKMVVERVRAVDAHLQKWESDVRHRLKVLTVATRAADGELTREDAARALMKLRGDAPDLGSQVPVDPGS